MVGEEDAALPNAGAAVNDTTCTGEEESKGNEGEARLQLQQQQQSQSNTLIVDHTPAEEEEAEASSSRRQRGVKMNDKNKKNDDDDSSLAPQVATEDRTLLYETGGGGKQNDNDDDDTDVYDDENEEAYMPIVDHTPKSSGKQQKHKSDSNNNYSNSALNRRDSMVVQVGTTSATNDDDDFDDDDFSKEDDGTASISNAAANNNNNNNNKSTTPPSRNIDTNIIPSNAAVVAVMVEPCVVLVDHTPQDTDSAARRGGRGPPRRRQQQRDLSMAVLPSIGNTTIDEMMDTNSINNNNTDDDDGYCIMMDQTLDFGPVVDHTPSLLYSNQKQEQQSASKKSNIQGDDSMAVCAPDFSQQQQDEGMYGDDDDDDDSSSTSSGVGDGNSTIDTQEQPNGHGKDDASSSELLQSSSLIIPQPLLLAKPLVIHDVKQEHVVDHTPMEMNHHAKSKSEHAAAAAADLSVVVLATVDDLTRDTGVSDIDEDNEDIYKDENELDYAPIVDHTPPSVVVHAAAAALTTTPATSSALSFSSSCRFSVNNSMAVQVSALDQDYEQHDAMEETMDFLADGTTTVDGSVLHDWERDNDNNNETANKAGLKEKEVTNLVDHTPLEMASPTPVKNTDPSIAVLASIEDDDENVGETEEEDGVSGAVFGLVVDHLPTTPASASVRGTQCSDSVIVQVTGADQETVDEITRDDGSTTTTDGDTIDDGDGGGGAASSVFRSPEGKLVDHVPSVRDSRLTGDASTLVAADASENLDDMAPDESYFDLFGPVVDVIPSPILPVSRSQRHAHAPAAEVVVVVTTTTAASDTNVVVDHVPQMRERLTDDSLATMGLSKLSEEETDDDEEEDDDRQFGPIVDQLPTPRPSRAASRGGCSTVDDLATISEAACPGDNEWEDDDLDMSLQSERIYSSQQPQTPAAGASRDIGVLRRVLSGSSSADKGVSSVVRFETSGFHDAANSSGGGWYDENGPTESVLPTASFEDAETPPTTPHQRTRHAGKRTLQKVPINEELLQPFDLHPDHSNAATTTRCSKLLNVTKKNGSMFGTLITPEGTSLEVDFGNLLLQGDDNAPTISKEEATPYSQGRLSTTTELEEELFQLRQANACFREKIESLQTETAKLRQDNSRLTSDLMSARRKEEVNELLDESSKPASVTQQGAVVFLEASDVEQEAKKLAQDVKEAELSLLSALRQDNSRLTANLASAQRRIEELEESKTAWGKQQAAVEAEIVKLKQLAHNEFRR